MLFRQLFDPATSTYTYLLADLETREALLIDTVHEQVDRDAQLVEQLGLTLVATLETHVHADHVTGAWLLKQRLGSQILYPARSGVTGADRLVDEGESVHLGRRSIEVRLTPGHTTGCASYVLDDLSKVFTGDALLIRGSGRTDFQQGDAHTLYRSVRDQIFSLPDGTEVYPGHDYAGRTVSTVGEEKKFNTRFGQGNTEADFVRILSELNLAYPRDIDRAVPANLNLGREVGDPAAPERAPLGDFGTRSATGVRHVTPAWVGGHLGQIRIVDVRELSEWNGELGRIDGAELVPMGQIPAAAKTWDPHQPLVLVCRSSGRSDAAARALQQAGFDHVASMVGGMLAWHDQPSQPACG